MWIPPWINRSALRLPWGVPDGRESGAGFTAGAEAAYDRGTTTRERAPMPYPVPTVVMDGLNFPEGPRWHDGRLWFSDMHARRVMTLDPGGQTSVICEVPEKPSGLGVLEDGRLLV